MKTNREGFNSSIGFVLASAGSAVGLGNIWGFPTQVASHGGGAFLLVYLIVILLLAVPALYAELSIGHKGQANPVSSLQQVLSPRYRLGTYSGYLNLLGAILLLSFYSIVAGWMLAFALAAVFKGVGLTDASQWLTSNSISRNLLFTLAFVVMTAFVIMSGVKEGIERWSKRLMPALFIMLIGLIIYMSTLPGAAQGFKTYLVPDFSKISDPHLVVAAMGQAFFSLSIGVGSMMVYGSYLKKGESLGKLTGFVAVLDTLVAFLAGLLIIPALFVAQAAGANIFSGGELVAEDQLIFQVLPELFDTLGGAGIIVSALFFTLLSVASLTSTISATEVPVAYLTEDKNQSRSKATVIISAIVLASSSLLIFNFSSLFGLVISLVTQYQLPLMGLFYFIVVGWLWKSGNKLHDAQTSPLLRNYLKFVCPVLMTIVFVDVAFFA